MSKKVKKSSKRTVKKIAKKVSGIPSHINGCETLSWLESIEGWAKVTDKAGNSWQVNVKTGEIRKG
jgi:hypothetical protein